MAAGGIIILVAAKEKLLNSYREEVQSMKTIDCMTMTGIKKKLS